MSVHWGGRGFGHVSRKTATGFNGAAIFTAGRKGIWHEFDPANLFQNSNGTTAVAATNPVGYVLDKSPNGLHSIQATAGNKPIFQQAAGINYLDYDETDDVLASTFSGGTLSSSMYVVFGAYKKTGTASVPISAVNSGGKFILCAEGSSGLASSNSAGTPTYAVNGTAVPGGTGATRAQVYTAWLLDQVVVIEAIGVDMSGWTGFAIGDYPSFAGLDRVVGGLMAVDSPTAAEQTAMRSRIGVLAGVPL